MQKRKLRTEIRSLWFYIRNLHIKNQAKRK